MSPQIATSTPVSRDELLDFIRPRHQAIVLTARADGRPQASPVTCGVDAEGRIVVSTYPERAKTRNARRNSQVSVLVLSDDFGGPWVQVDGGAEVIDMPEAAEALVDYYRAIAGEHPDWDEYRAGHDPPGQVAAPHHADVLGPVATGGFPPRLAVLARGDPRSARHTAVVRGRPGIPRCHAASWERPAGAGTRIRPAPQPS